VLEFLLDDGDQDIGEGAPNLRFDRVVGGWAQTELAGGCIRELLRIACGRTFRLGCAMAVAKESA
jgi:hypothetical protein